MRIGERLAWIVAAASAALAACGGGGGGSPGGGARALPAANPWVVSPVEAWGKLKVCGAHLCAEDGTTRVQLRGMSLFWSNTGWGAERFYHPSLVNGLADQWNATVVRAAIGAQGGGGYAVSDDPRNPVDPAGNLARARAVIDAAIEKGIYVIVDWHSHTLLTDEAQDFFETLAAEYVDAPNVIWEPFNEPPGNTYGWPALKAYHEAVIATIRAQGSTNLAVVGSPFWSQDVDVASATPVEDSAGNTAYTLHFYAHTHGAQLRTKAETAMGNGAAIFVTEWGTCDASGNGGFDPPATQAWLDWMDEHGISSANWSMNDKAETASALVPGAGRDAPWTAGELTDSGWLVLPYVHSGYAYDLRVTRAGAGAVTSSPAGISCGSACTVDFTRATAITLTATPAEGSSFTGWSGDCTGTASCVVTMDAEKNVTATFAASPPPP